MGKTKKTGKKRNRSFSSSVINDFTELLDISLKFLASHNNDTEELYWYLINPDLTYPVEGKKALDGFIDKVLGFRDNQSLFSRQGIEELAFHLIYSFADVPEIKERDIRKSLDSGYKRIVNNLMEGEYIVLLDGIDYRLKRPLKIAGYTIGRMSRYSRIFKATARSTYKTLESRDISHFGSLVYPRSEILNKTYLCYHTKGDFDTIINNSKYAISRYIDILNYYSYFYESYFARCRVTVYGTDEESWVKPFFLRDSGSLSFTSYRVRKGFTFDLTSERYNDMKRNKFRAIVGLLGKAIKGEAISGFQRQILKAIIWFSNGIKSYERVLSFFSFMTVLETIYSQRSPKEDRSISDKVAEGVALCLYKDLKKRKEIRRYIKSELYKKRSGIVHGGAFEIDDRTVYDASYFAHQSITYMIKNLDRFDNTVDFSDMLIDRRLR